MSTPFGPDIVPVIAVNDRVILLKSIKSAGFVVQSGMRGVVVEEFTSAFMVKFDGVEQTLMVHRKFVKKRK